MHKKRCLALLLVALMLLSLLTACEKNKKDPSTSNDAGSSSTSDSDTQQTVSTTASGTSGTTVGGGEDTTGDNSTTPTTTTSRTTVTTVQGGTIPTGDDPMLKTLSAYKPGLSGITMSKGISDTLDLSSSSSKNDHGLKTVGSVSSTKITTDNGTIKETYTALKFAGKGAKAEFTLDLSSPKATSSSNPMMLEIMEVHNNNYCAFGYTVQINGKDVYFRTYEELATGTIHYFIPFSRSLVSDPSKVKVTIISEDASAFSIGMVWGYNDFYGLMEDEDVLTKMGLNLFCSGDVAKGAAFTKKYAGLKSFTPNPLYEVDYMNHVNATSASALSAFSNAAAKAGTGVQLMPKKYWLFADGADGKGGKWSDLKYQQVQYNAANKTYTNTTPNGWSNTHWLSFSNSYLNNASCDKLSKILSSFADNFALSAAKGKMPNMVQMIMEHGTGYYHESDFYGGDFSYEIVQLAKERGVTLDPTDGLSYEEKRYMYFIIAEMNQLLADTYSAALGRAPVLVQNGKVTLPAYQPTENMYSHGTQTADQWISYDDRITGWMSGIGSGYWPSSENMWFDDQRLYEYQLGYGRIGCVNLEMYIHGNKEAIQSYLRQGYRNGMEYVTMFNDLDEYNTYNNVKAIDGLQSEAVSEYHYERSYLDVDYMRDFNTDMISKISMTPGVVSYDNCKVGTTGNLFCSDVKKVGIATYKVSAPTALENGIKLYLEGKASSGASIQIYGGTDLNKLSKVGTFSFNKELTWFNKYSGFNLDLTSQTKGVKEYYIQIRMSNVGASAANTSIRAIKVTTPWDTATGSLTGITTTYAQRRMQNLWVAEREALESLMQDYKEQGGNDSVYQNANKLYGYGRYKSANELLTGEVSQLLPAKYAINGNGKLGKYPINVSMASGQSAVVELRKVSGSEILFRVLTDKKQTLTIEVSSLVKGAYYLLEKTGDDSYRIVMLKGSASGAVKAESGKATFKLDAAPVKTERLSNTVVTGRVQTNCNGSNILLQVQDPTIGEYSAGVTFQMMDTCTYTRQKEGSSSTEMKLPRAGDMAIITLDENGFVSNIKAIYGQVTGKIVKFQPPTVTGKPCNGIITLDNGVSYEIEYSSGTTKFNTDRLSGEARTLAISRIAREIKVGQKVTITYCPETTNGSYRRILTLE
ncbi:MAG: hypothetical protein IKL13_05825 [Clostridia bacterium]|nr:hypothetical protein [Clostridia bacterium]